MASHPLRGLSICTGIGGLELGLHQALGGDYVPVCYVEGEAYAASVLVSRMADETLGAAPIWSDVRTFDPKPWRGCVDIVSAGIPCQPWSQAGKRRGADDERHLWAPVCAIIEELAPKYVLIENVPGLLSKDGLEPIWRDLLRMGYEVEAGIFSAAEVGAPHLRKRIFVLAHADHAIGRSLSAARRDMGGQHRGVRHRRHKAAGNAAKGGAKNVADAHGQPGDQGFHALWRWKPDVGGAVWRPTQPPVCGGNDGPADRLDRLRALGNAVVPACAALAVQTLLKEIEA